MNPRVREIFFKAHELKGQERLTYLLGECGEDTALRAEVERMLQAAERADSLLGVDDEDDTLSDLGLDGPSDDELEGTVIGPYTLRQKIGEGGFGTVWMAEQFQPITRMVALKVIKPGMDSKQVLARFEAERQALALMDHPNISKILDAGTAPDGRPYFAMELVKGVPLTEFCQEQKLDTQQRLELFQDVCSAVSHAHDKGVIHRDLKPSNVLVAMLSGKPTPKVIDFGIAKAMQGRLTEKTLFTRFEQFMGTPNYMSPEQAGGETDIDTRADIYSLGALLYELLTGSPPFGNDQLKEAGFGEIVRILREEDPQKPSTRVTTGTSHPMLNLNALPPEKLRGDLDWIVMQALRKERERRYQSAEQLGEDIRRHLEHEPVSAAAPSLRYRLGKFSRRHRVGLAMLSTVLVLTAVGTLIGMKQAQRASVAETRETAAQALAMNNRAKAFRDTALNQGPNYTRSALWFAKAAAVAADPALVAANMKRADMWARHAWTPVRAFQSLAGEVHVTKMVFHPHLPFLLVETRGENHHITEKKIELWDLKAEEPLALGSRDSFFRAAAWKPDGSVLAVATQAGSIQIWTVPDWQLAEEWDGSDVPDNVTEMRYSDSGHRLAIGGQRVRVRDCESDTWLGVPLEQSGSVQWLGFNGSSDLLGVFVSDAVRVYRPADARDETLYAPVPHRQFTYWTGTPKFTGGDLATQSGPAMDDVTLTIVDEATGKTIHRLRPPGPVVSGCPHSRNLACTGGVIGLTGTPRHFMTTEGDEEMRFAHSPDGGVIVGGSSVTRVWDTSFTRWTADSPIEVASSEQTIGHFPVSSLAWAEDGCLLARATQNGMVRIFRVWEEAWSHQLWLGEIPHYPVFSEDHQWVATAGTSAPSHLGSWGLVQVYAAEDFTLAAPGMLVGGHATHAVFGKTPSTMLVGVGRLNPQRQATGYAHGEVQLWDWQTAQRLAKLTTPSEPRDLQVLDDGRFLVLCDGGELLELDAACGNAKIIATSGATGTHLNSLHLDSGETLAIILGEKQCEAVDLASGHVRWSQASGMGQYVIEAAIQQDILAFVDGADSTLVTLDAQTGAPSTIEPRDLPFYVPGESPDVAIPGTLWVRTKRNIIDAADRIPLYPGISDEGLTKPIMIPERRAAYRRVHQSLERNELGRWAAPTLTPPDRVRLAELDAAERIEVETQTVVALTEAEWFRRWQAFRKDHPNYHNHQLAPELSKKLDWFRHQAASLRGAEVNLSRLQRWLRWDPSHPEVPGVLAERSVFDSGNDAITEEALEALLGHPIASRDPMSLANACYSLWRKNEREKAYSTATAYGRVLAGLIRLGVPNNGVHAFSLRSVAASHVETAPPDHQWEQDIEKLAAFPPEIRTHLAALLADVALAPTLAPPQLAGSWQVNQPGAEERWLDSAGGNHLVATGAPERTDKAFIFNTERNRPDSFSSQALDYALAGSEAFTAVAVFKPYGDGGSVVGDKDAFSKSMLINATSATVPHGWCLAYGENAVWFGMGDSHSNRKRITAKLSPPSPMNDHWWIAVVTWTASGPLGRPALKMYLFDQELRHHAPRLEGAPHEPRGTTGFTIGAQHGLPEAGRFSGEIAAVRFYEGYANRAEAKRLAEDVGATVWP